MEEQDKRQQLLELIERMKPDELLRRLQESGFNVQAGHATELERHGLGQILTKTDSPDFERFSPESFFIESDEHLLEQNQAREDFFKEFDQIIHMFDQELRNASARLLTAASTIENYGMTDKMKPEKLKTNLLSLRENIGKTKVLRDKIEFTLAVMGRYQSQVTAQKSLQERTAQCQEGIKTMQETLQKASQVAFQSDLCQKADLVSE